MRYFNHGKTSFDYSYKSFNSIPNIYNDELRVLFEFETKIQTKKLFGNFAASVQKLMNIFLIKF